MTNEEIDPKSGIYSYDSVISTKELREGLSDHLGRVQYAGARLVITRNGKPVAALVHIKDLRALEWVEDQSDIAAIREVIAEGGDFTPYEDIRKEMNEKFGLK